nr:GNAT family N-acetyltransferase [Coxiella burnetii]
MSYKLIKRKEKHMINLYKPIKSNLHFTQVTKKYKETILNWFKEKHVNEFFYGEGLQNTLRNLDLYCRGIDNNGRYSFDHWIAFYDEIPFSFIMTSPVIGPYDPADNYNKWYEENRKKITLDLLIGPKEFLSKGLAHLMIQQFILTQYANADFFIIDPEKSNSKAIHVYEKVGFKKVDEFCPPHSSTAHLMMRLNVKDLKK